MGLGTRLGFGLDGLLVLGRFKVIGLWVSGLRDLGVSRLGF